METTTTTDLGRITYSKTLKDTSANFSTISPDKYEAYCLEHGEAYELIFDSKYPDRPVKLVLDFDLGAKDCVNENEPYPDGLTEYVIEETLKLFENNNIICDSITKSSSASYFCSKTKAFKWKISVHFVFNTILGTLPSQSYLVHNLFNPEMKNVAICDILKIKDTWTWFDENIYKTNQRLRSTHCSKSGENRPLTIVKGTFQDSVITAFIPEGDNRILQPPTKIEKVIFQSNSSCNIEVNDAFIHKYLDYTRLIKKTELSKYLVWFKFQRASANLKIPFEIYDNEMKQIDNYNEAENKEYYEKTDDDKNGRLGFNYIKTLAEESNPTEKALLDEKYSFCFKGCHKSLLTIAHEAKLSKEKEKHDLLIQKEMKRQELEQQKLKLKDEAIALKLKTAGDKLIQKMEEEQRKEETKLIAKQAQENKKETEKLKVFQANKDVIAGDDKEAGDKIYKLMRDEDCIYYCNGVLYFKSNHIWTANEKQVKISMLNYVLSSEIKSFNSMTGSLLPYAQNVVNAKHIVEVIIGLALKDNDDGFYKKLLTTTKHKLCFQNGVLNIKTKQFSEWDKIEKKDAVYSTMCITRKFNSTRNEKIITDVKTDIFSSIFGDDATKAMNFLSRGLAGDIQDKAWGLFIGNRDCGKGVIENFYKSTFQSYVTTLNSDVFMCERLVDAGDVAKKLAWALDCEFPRISFTQEIKFDTQNPHIKIDGTKIKKQASGGDICKARRNYMDEKEFVIQARLFMMGNDIPPIEPKDAMETCVSFSSTKQFKSTEYIQARKEANASAEELEMYKLGNPEIKQKCITEEYADALIHLMCDTYCENAVAVQNKFCDEEDEANVFSLVMKSFKLDASKRITNAEMKSWCSTNNISMSGKLKPILKQMGCFEFRNEAFRGLSGVHIVTTELTEEE